MSFGQDVASEEADPTEPRVEELRLEVVAMQSTLAWRLAERLRQIFPTQTRRGRVLREWLRRMLGGVPR